MKTIVALTIECNLQETDMRNWKSLSSKLIRARADKSLLTCSSIDIEKVQNCHSSVSIKINMARDHLDKLRVAINSPVNWPKIHHVKEKVEIKMPELLNIVDPLPTYLMSLDGFFHSLYTALEIFAGEVCLCYRLSTRKPTLRSITKEIEKFYSNEPISSDLSNFVNNGFYKHLSDTRHMIAHNISLGLIYCVDISQEGEITTQNLCLPDNPKKQPFSANEQLKTIPYCENALIKTKGFLETSYKMIENFLLI